MSHRSIVSAVLLFALLLAFCTARAQETPRDTLPVKVPRDSISTLATIVVATGRVSRRIEDEPERLEILAGKDVDEKSVMRPSDPTHLLSEMPGVRVQVTSPALAGAGIRLRGLRGRYTLTLSDGLPLYGQAEGIGFLDIPPIDLAQAEVIKGAATALYGPAALGGVLNIISRRPPRSGSQTDVIANATSLGGNDLVAWHGERVDTRIGFTALAGVHSQARQDIDGDGWANIPRFKRAETRIRGFLSRSSGSNGMMTSSASAENRTGGLRQLPVSADTRHWDLGGFAHLISGSSSLITLRGSAGIQSQHRSYGDSIESDMRTTVLGEATYSYTSTSTPHTLLAGSALNLERLASPQLPGARYSFTTGSMFVQDTYTPTESLAFAGTMRIDQHSRYGTMFSPRLSALARLGSGWALRAAAGQGSSAPTSLVEEVESVGLSRLRGFSELRTETLRNVSTDLNGKMGAVEVNASAFSANLRNAVVAGEGGADPRVITLINAPSPTRIRGAEFFAVYDVEPVTVTVLYALTDATEWSADKSRRIRAPLTPRQSAGVDLAFAEDESGTRVGVELFYTGKQALEDNPYRNTGAPYITIGLLGQQRIGKVTLFINADNITNVRQTRFDPLLLSPRKASGRFTTDQWAPLEGRVINLGGRFRF